VLRAPEMALRVFGVMVREEFCAVDEEPAFMREIRAAVFGDGGKGAEPAPTRGVRPVAGVRPVRGVIPVRGVRPVLREAGSN
jgi:hypothetical protein